MDKCHDIINLLIGGAITFYFFSNVCREKKKGGYKVMAVLLYIPIILIGDRFLGEHKIFMGIYQFIIMFLAIRIIYEVSALYELLLLILQQFIFVATAYIVSGGIMMFGSRATIYSILLEQDNAGTVDVLVYLLAFLVLKAVSVGIRRFQTDIPVYMYAVLSLGGVVNILCMIENSRLVAQAGLKSKEAYFSSLLPVVLFFFYILSFILFQRYVQLQKRMQQEQLRQKYTALDQSYFESLRRQQDEIRKLNHDMKNHIIVMQGLLEHKRGDYASQLLEELEKKRCYYDMDNGIADIIFQEKQQIAKEKNISLEVAVERGILKPYSEVCICTILGNAIDNAIEACTGTKYKITIKGISNSVGVILTVENGISADTYAWLKKAGRTSGYTSKKNACEHGMGIQNIETSVQQLKGNLCIQMEEKKYRITIILPHMIPVRTGL